MKTTTHLTTFGATAIALFAASSVAQAATVSATPSTWGVLQGEFQTGSPTSPTWATSNSNADRSGAGGSAGNQRVNEPVWGFTLPSIGAGEVLTTVDFGFTMASTAENSGPTHDVVISLMNYDQIADFSGADYVTTVGSLGNGTLVATFDQNDTSNNAVLTFALTGDALTQFQGFYDASGNPTQSEIWFRLSYDNFTWDWGAGGNANDRYQFLDDDTGNVTRSLEITTVPIPEPSALALLGLGAVGLVARRRRRR